MLASCRLHLPVRAGRGFLNSWGGAVSRRWWNHHRNRHPAAARNHVLGDVLVRAGFAPRGFRGLWSLASVTPERRRVTPG